MPVFRFRFLALVIWRAGRAVWLGHRGRIAGGKGILKLLLEFGVLFGLFGAALLRGDVQLVFFRHASVLP